MATIYSGSDAGKSGLEMVEIDGSPDIRGVTKIKVSNTTLTDDGNGEVTLQTGGGGGGMTSWTLRGNSGSNQTITDADNVTFSGSGGLTTVASAVDTLTVQTTGVLEDLNTLGAPTADGEFIVATGAGAFAYETGATARTSLGLGTIATQDANTVAITGGSITGITDLAIADGGTGQSTAQTAINALTAVAGATDEFVFTKDTATGDAVWKAASGGGVTLSGSTNNTISTVTGANALQGEANLTFNGTILTVTGNLSVGVDAASTVGFMGVTPVPQQTATPYVAQPSDPTTLGSLAGSTDLNLADIQQSIGDIITALQQFGLLA